MKPEQGSDRRKEDSEFPTNLRLNDESKYTEAG